MSVERATIETVPKPWGQIDLRPWSDTVKEREPIGELWFGRPDVDSPKSALLFKLIFANQPLSIQVHPDDAFARERGLPNGKTEAWYILSAVAGAQIALGLTRQLAQEDLRAAIVDGSIQSLAAWRLVVAGDVIIVPAGTIHAIGAGVVLAEIQQNSDTTFRLFDFGRGRDLHVEDAIAVADTRPLSRNDKRRRIDLNREILVEEAHFILERIELGPLTSWGISPTRETLVFMLAGSAAFGLINVETGGGAFLSAGDYASVVTGSDGLTALVSYRGPDAAYRFLTEVSDVLNASLPELRPIAQP